MEIGSFRLWLQNKNYSGSTVRNYLVDINKYLATTDSPFSQASLTTYLQSISTDPNLPRTLSSLNKFCQFAYSQNIISENPLKPAAKQLKTTPTITIDMVVSDFQEYLTKHNSSQSTIRNYINDLHQYISWANSEPR
jgi:site-specific recombinase XerD